LATVEFSAIAGSPGILESDIRSKTLKGRLVLINPQTSSESAAFSPLVVEDQGRILLTGDDWAKVLPVKRLEDVAANDIRTALSLYEDDITKIYLSGIRELPEGNPLSPEFLNFVAAWWHEEATRLLSKTYATLAS